MRHDRAHLSITMETPATLITPQELKKLTPGEKKKSRKVLKSGHQETKQHIPP